MNIRDRTETLLLDERHTLLNPTTARHRARLRDEFVRLQAVQPLSEFRLDEPDYFQTTFAQFVAGHIQRQLSEMERQRQAHVAFTDRFTRARRDFDRRVLMLDYAAELGATPRQLRGDKRAFKRWFDKGALDDRFAHRLAEREQATAYALERLGVICAGIIQHQPESPGLIDDLRLNSTLEPFLGYDGDSRVTLAALRAFHAAVVELSERARESALSGRNLQFVYRAALDAQQPVWIQCEAIALIGSLSIASLKKVIQRRFAEPREGDDRFVRARTVLVWADALGDHPELGDLLVSVAVDGSELVRQRLAQVAHQLPADLRTAYLELPIGFDPAPAVRGAWVLSLLELARPDAPTRDRATALLLDTLAGEKDEFVYRCALHVLPERLETDRSSGETEAWLPRCLTVLDERHRRDPSLKVRRWSAQTRERLVCAATPAWRAAGAHLRTLLQAQQSGTTRTHDAPAGTIDRDTLGRICAAVAQNDFGLDVDRTRRGRLRVTRGFRFRFRFWRYLYELGNPSTVKRQGFRHTIGRHFAGRMRAPSEILAEVSKTRVPGEPLTLASEGGWRPYLPLMDDLFAVLDQDAVEPHRIYTSEGVTVIEPPASLAGRIRAWWMLCVRFRRLAELRNWREGDQQAADAYVTALAGLGFRIRHHGHSGDPDSGRPPSVDPAVTRFFTSATSAGVSLPLLPTLLRDFKDHAVSAYESTIAELAVFVVLIGAWFFTRHVVLSRMMRRARNRIPLVIGGWGTRGKSGTERIKAALFNALGYSVFSKTSGCEAMFVTSRPYRRLRELFLFRPYDKASIWEQFDMVRLASRLKADVFLWECMGLTPSYVRVLQQSWMRDDLATITNAFPDHEDLQGPAGINIPDVMCEFIPPRSRLVTSEETMLPILQEGAERQQTALTKVNWLHAGMLTRDVLDRFPYEEHPQNIALVLAVGDQLGVDRDFAVKEMADRVIPDLGVLKSYPVATVRGRRLQFAMGMSANERFATLGNWERMGFADVGVEEHPEQWLTTVVNNRADRVQRSRVFAGILVNDLSCDQHVIVGTNLKGMRGYIEAAWSERIADISLWQGSDGPGGTVEDAIRVLALQAGWLRIPHDPEQLRARLGVVLSSGAGLADCQTWRDFERLVDDADRSDSQRRFAQVLIAQYRDYAEFADRVRRHEDRDTLEHEFRDLLWRWFESKLVFVEDAHIDGDALVAAIAELTPPGMLNRIMGMQNIKGAGLAFVYAWQAWEQLYRLGEAVRAADRWEALNAALTELAAFRDYGRLASSYVAALVEYVAASPFGERPAVQAHLAAVREHAAASVADPERERRTPAARLGPLLGWLEKFLDAGDAVRRRKLADAVYRDLVAERISEDRAIVEIRAVNRRQQGGWLRWSGRRRKAG